jgi:transposase
MINAILDLKRRGASTREVSRLLGIDEDFVYDVWDRLRLKLTPADVKQIIHEKLEGYSDHIIARYMCFTHGVVGGVWSIFRVSEKCIPYLRKGSVDTVDHIIQGRLNGLTFAKLASEAHVACDTASNVFNAYIHYFGERSFDMEEFLQDVPFMDEKDMHKWALWYRRLTDDMKKRILQTVKENPSITISALFKTHKLPVSRAAVEDFLANEGLSWKERNKDSGKSWHAQKTPDSVIDDIIRTSYEMPELTAEEIIEKLRLSVPTKYVQGVLNGRCPWRVTQTIHSTDIIDDIVASHACGESTCKISERVGLSVPSVYKILEKHGQAYDTTDLIMEYAPRAAAIEEVSRMLAPYGRSLTTQLSEVW